MRCNVGINPFYLADQHLIAEYRELPMVIGSLRINDWKIKTEAKPVFSLGTGHINWFKRRLLYLSKRHEEVKIEMVKRGFKCDFLKIDTSVLPSEFLNDWTPSLPDSIVIRQRINEKLLLKPTFYRYYSNKIIDINQFIDQMMISELYKV